MPKKPKTIAGHLHAIWKGRSGEKRVVPPKPTILVITSYIKPSGSTGFKKSWRRPKK